MATLFFEKKLWRAKAARSEPVRGQRKRQLHQYDRWR